MGNIQKLNSKSKTVKELTLEIKNYVDLTNLTESEKQRIGEYLVEFVYVAKDEMVKGISEALKNMH